MLVQVVAAVTLSASDLGVVAVVAGLLAVVAAAHRGLLGEVLLHCDRTDGHVRAALVTLALALALVAAPG